LVQGPVEAEIAGPDMTLLEDRAPGTFRAFTRPFVHYFTSGSGPQPTAFVAAKPLDPKVKADLTEDMSVMSRLLQKATNEQETSPTALNIQLKLVGTPSSLRSLYLEGYGLVFFVETPMPLKPTSTAAEAAPQPDTHSAWEEAKEEIYGSPTPRNDVILEQQGQPQEPYDPQKVDQMENAVLGALKNATHLRHLEPNDRLVVVINSSVPSRGGGGNVFAMRDDAGAVTRIMTRPVINGTPGAGERHSVTITVRKSDADELGAGKLSLDDFRKKAAIVVD